MGVLPEAYDVSFHVLEVACEADVSNSLLSVFELLRNKVGDDGGSETHPPLTRRIQRLEALLDETE